MTARRSRARLPLMGSTAIKSLAQAIEQRFGSTPVYVESIPIHETFEGQTVWEGIVHVFDIEGGQRCYAWAHLEDGQSGKQRIVTVLHQPPVDSPLAAVQAAIVQEHRQQKGTEDG
jgi:hypothetical protein